MRVHHLNCGTMRPPAAPGGLVCHVLLIETENGLALVDSGLGRHDADSPGARFGVARHYVRPVFDPAEAAITRIRELGHDPRDVRHIVLTHFDADHVGGLADFPWAQVHLTDAEALAARHPRTLVERQRYRPAQRSHTPDLIAYPPTGEAWRGFESARELTAIAPGIVLINLPGHTRGHAAVAVDAGAHWILHAGDAFYHHAQLDGTNAAPRSLTAMERGVAADWPRVRANHELLRQLWWQPDPSLALVNSHDPYLLARVLERA
ncbi:MBL fold metallo-hydrolase [Nocardia sp. NPDC058058]|uniref:MBL fold metallo-hydrolase n=1 Tax=Nocardia sp. NPDC058058 TaxID=3346317 RepID=UPI0036DAF43F